MERTVLRLTISAQIAPANTINIPKSRMKPLFCRFMIRLENIPNQCDESVKGIVSAIALFSVFF